MPISVALWSEEQSDQHITVRALDRGRCALECHLEGISVEITSSPESLRGALRGARTHYASRDGTCEIWQSDSLVHLRIQQWKGREMLVDVPERRFEEAFRELTRENVKLL